MVTALYPSFFRYMESTRHLLFYRLDSSHTMPALFHMPHVNQLSVIQCAPISITRLLQPKYFPSLQRIHYLSTAPFDTQIHTQLSRKTEWVFPVADHPFYNAMTEGGYGRKDEWLIRNHIVGEKKMDGSRWFDLYLPLRSIVCGNWYYQQQMAYLHKKHCDGFQLTYPIHKEYQTDFHLLPSDMSTTAVLDSRWIYQQQCVERIFLKTIGMKDT